MEKTLEINPDYVDAMNALAIYYYSQKNYSEATLYAEALYQRGIALPPEFLQLLEPPKIP